MTASFSFALLRSERLFGFADDMGLILARITRLIKILPVFEWYAEFTNLKLHRSKTQWLIGGYVTARDLARWLEWATASRAGNAHTLEADHLATRCAAGYRGCPSSSEQSWRPGRGLVAAR